MFERQVALQEPFRQGGIQALNKLVAIGTLSTNHLGCNSFSKTQGMRLRLVPRGHEST